MTIGLVGRKAGMTRIFTEDGVSTPVTVIEVEPNRVSQIKTVEVDGYNAIQVTVGSKKASRVTKPQAGHFAKAESAAGSQVCEFTIEEATDLALGSEINVSIFEAGQAIDVSGVIKGKGFAGVVKRYGFRGGDATHGNSLSHRAPGSIGQCQTPGRVFKGKKNGWPHGRC
jgi:large subunit ribosomal protein L3